MTRDLRETPPCASATGGRSDLPEGVTEDAFLGGRLSILQPRSGYRAGIDAVLLAAAVPCVAGREADAPLRVLDAGAGVGTVGLCVAERISGCQVVLLEQEGLYAALAEANVARNGLGGRVRVARGSVGGPAADLASQGLDPESFDIVCANPPFHDRAAGTASSVEIKAAAHAMEAGGLEVWARFLARMAAPGGRVIVIHKAEALGGLMAALSRRFGGLAVLPIHPREGEPAHRLLVTGRKGSRAPDVILPGLVLHGEGNGFLPGIDAILRHGARLDLGRAI